MTLRLESDEGKTARRADVFTRLPSTEARRARRVVRAAIVLGLGAALFAAGVLFGRAGGPGNGPEPLPQLVGFDAASIQLLDASLRLDRIDPLDAGAASGR